MHHQLEQVDKVLEKKLQVLEEQLTAKQQEVSEF
jgi:hypothetical protein